MTAAAVLPRSTHILWGIGSLGTNSILYVHSLLLLFFLVSILDIAPVLAGALIAGAKLFDAFADPFIGWMSDNTRGSWGRRAPYMGIATLLLAISAPLLFAAPELSGDARLWWAVAALLLFSLGYGLFNVPYLAMPAELTPLPHERTVMMSWRIGFVGVAGIVSTAGAPLLIERLGGGREAYAAMGWIVGAIVLVTLAIATTTALRHRDRERPPTERLPLGTQFAAALRARPFMLLCGGKFFQLLGLASVSATLPFFVTQIMERPTGALAIFGLTTNIVQLGSMAVWVSLARTRTKRGLCLVAIGIYAVVLATWALSGPQEPTWVFVLRSAAMGFGAGGLLLMGQSMLPDAIAYERTRTGQASEASFSGIYAFVEKTASALGSLIIGGLLSAFGYVTGLPKGVAQPDSALTAIMIGATIVPVLCAAASAAMIWSYGIDERQGTAATT